MIQPETGVLTRNAKIAAWALQIVAAVILAQTLFFKFSGAVEPVYIFTKLGVEPWGRYLAAVSELIAVVLLLWPRMAVAGAAMAIGIMIGAIGAHLGPLGIEVKGDGGLLFGLGIVVLAASIGVVLIRRADVVKMFRAPISFVLAGR